MGLADAFGFSKTTTFLATVQLHELAQGKHSALLYILLKQRLQLLLSVAVSIQPAPRPLLSDSTSPSPARPLPRKVEVQGRNDCA
jgi:hypothetical protein